MCHILRLSSTGGVRVFRSAVRVLARLDPRQVTRKAAADSHSDKNSLALPSKQCFYIHKTILFSDILYHQLFLNISPLNYGDLLLAVCYRIYFYNYN